MCHRHNHKVYGYGYGCRKLGQFMAGFSENHKHRHKPSLRSMYLESTILPPSTPNANETRLANTSMGKQPRWIAAEDVASCRAYLRVSEDPVVGSNQTSGALEARVGAEFEQLVPSTLAGAAREVRLARSGRSIVRRFKLIKAACLALESKRNIVVAARITGATDVDVERVALMLYNAKGFLADAYDAIGSKEHDIGPNFPFEESRVWMEEKGFLQQLDSDRRVDVEASAILQDVEGSEAPENESGELRGTGETVSRPVGTKQAKRRQLDHARDSKLADAVSSIAESQRKRLEESRRRNNIALMQSEDVPEDMRKAFFRAMARKLLDESGVELSAHSATTQSEDEE
jgi:hypothetical protein